LRSGKRKRKEKERLYKSPSRLVENFILRKKSTKWQATHKARRMARRFKLFGTSETPVRSPPRQWLFTRHGRLDPALHGFGGGNSSSSFGLVGQHGPEGARIRTEEAKKKKNNKKQKAIGPELVWWVVCFVTLSYGPSLARAHIKRTQSSRQVLSVNPPDRFRERCAASPKLAEPGAAAQAP